MTIATDHPAVRAYLAELHRLLEGVPDRDLIVEGVAQHVADALGAGPSDPARVQAVLDELGDPAMIAEEARGSAPSAPLPFLQRRGGAVLTVALLTFGGLVIPVAGWIVGLGLLWFSRGWKVWEKLVGTLAPFVLAGVLVAVGTVIDPQSSHLAVLIGLLAGAVAAGVFLLRRFRAGAGA
ncbi:HAAS signaling domain-containing protein [Amnibacterium kyonggiense]